jgi:hypothetical protein
VSNTPAENLCREYFREPEKLKTDARAPNIRGGIDKLQASVQITVMVASDLRNEGSPEAIGVCKEGVGHCCSLDGRRLLKLDIW